MLSLYVMVCFSPLLSAVLLDLQYLQAAHTHRHTYQGKYILMLILSLSFVSPSVFLLLSLAHTDADTHVHMYRNAVACGPRHTAQSIQTKNLHGF